MSAPYPRRAYAEGPFGQIHYQTMGEGPAVVLLHQAPMTSFQYDNVYEPLARRGFKAIGIDMPGFGMSDPTDFVPSVEDFALCVVPVLDALGIEKAAVLGHHTGALVANEVAVRFPERISALIMNGPMPVTEEERQNFMDNGYVREVNMVAESGGDYLTRVFAARERLAAGTLPLDRIGNFVIQAFMGRGKYFYGHHAAFQYRQDEALPKIAVPAMILTNTGDMIYDHALRAHAIRPDITLVELDGGGVDIVDQQPEEWADAVAAFLNA
jgi:pimeloyl-ACP methyl ester carboxylesterase